MMRYISAPSRSSRASSEFGVISTITGVPMSAYNRTRESTMCISDTRARIALRALVCGGMCRDTMMSPARMDTVIDSPSMRRTPVARTRTSPTCNSAVSSWSYRRATLASSKFSSVSNCANDDTSGMTSASEARPQSHHVAVSQDERVVSKRQHFGYGV